MGLEVVEFIIRVEETFGIAIKDSETEKVRTIGDLEQFMIHRLETEQRSSKGVYEAIIRVLVEEFDREPTGLNRQTGFVDDLEMT